MTVTIAALFAEHRTALLAAVDELTVEQKRPAPADDDPHRMVLAPALLVSVEQARLTRRRLTRRVRSTGSGAPGWLSVTELLADVDSTVGRAVGSRSSWSRCRRVRAWSARMLSSMDVPTIGDAAERAAWWVTAGRDLFTPRRWLPLRGATCPDCGFDRVVDGAGEVEPALVADTTTGSVLCLLDGCGGVWPAEHLHLLAEVLEQQTAVEHLGSA